MKKLFCTLASSTIALAVFCFAFAACTRKDLPVTEMANNQEIATQGTSIPIYTNTEGLNSIHIQRFVDVEAGVLCYTSSNATMMACVPLRETYIARYGTGR